MILGQPSPRVIAHDTITLSEIPAFFDYPFPRKLFLGQFPPTTIHMIL